MLLFHLHGGCCRRTCIVYSHHSCFGEAGSRTSIIVRIVERRYSGRGCRHDAACGDHCSGAQWRAAGITFARALDHRRGARHRGRYLIVQKCPTRNARTSNQKSSRHRNRSQTDRGACSRDADRRTGAPNVRRHRHLRCGRAFRNRGRRRPHDLDRSHGWGRCRFEDSGSCDHGRNCSQHHLQGHHGQLGRKQESRAASWRNQRCCACRRARSSCLGGLNARGCGYAF